jgi:hypothetical protein
VFHLARHNRRARATSARGCLGAFRDDNLVVHILINHIELVDVVVTTIVWRNEHNDTGRRPRCNIVYTDLGQLNTLGVEL